MGQPQNQLQDYFRNRLPRGGGDLLAVFSRFEFALKTGGFRRERHAEASWRRFAELLPANFIERMSSSPDAEVLFQAPPDRLVVDGAEGVRWSGNPSTPEGLLFHGRTVDSSTGTDGLSARPQSTPL